jgi:FSR family fosmidomycin resistance protein-like MFS transporter
VIIGAVALWGLENTYRLSFFGIIASLLLLIRLKDTNIQQDFTSQTHLTGLMETSKALLPLFLSITGIIFFKGAMLAALASFLPTYLTVKGSSVWIAGISLSIYQLGGLVGTLIAGSLSDTLGRKNVLFSTAVIIPVLMGGFLLSHSLFILPVLMILGFFLSATEPVLMALVQDNSSGRPAYANGVYMMLHFVTLSLMTMAVGVSSDTLGFENTYRLATFLSLGSIPCVLLLPGKLQLAVFIPNRRSSVKRIVE